MKDRFSELRLNAMFDLMSEKGEYGSKIPTSDLDQAAARAMRKATDRIGKKSEKRFDELAKNSDLIISMCGASIGEDVFQGVDKWVVLNKKYDLPPLPVQIVSSTKGVENFRKESKYHELHELEIVINCGPSSNPKTFKKDILSEIRRIEEVLLDNPNLLTVSHLKDSNSFKIR